MASETTSWTYEYGVRRADGKVRVRGDGAWDRSQAISWANSLNDASKRLGQKPGAKVIRRKVYTTTIVRKEVWERADQG